MTAVDNSRIDAGTDEGADRIGGEQFSALAAGYGGPDAVRLLSGTQLGRRRLLLRALVEEVRVRQPAAGAAAGIPAAMALLRAAQRRQPVAVAGALGLPHTGAWLAHCLRRLHGLPPGNRPLAADLAHLAGLAATAALAADLPFEITVPVLDGAAVLPSLGRVAVPAGLERAAVAGQPGLVTVRAAGRQIASIDYPPAPADPAAGAAWQTRRRLEVTAGDTAFTVAIEDIDPFRDCYGRDALPRVPAAGIIDFRDTLEAAWALLARDHPRYAEMLATEPVTVVPLRRPAPGREVSAASRHAFGSIGMSLPADPATLAELLVHEHNHMRLGALLDLVPLHRGTSGIRYRAPWRADPRPVGALLHGTYAHLGVADFLRVHRDTRTGRRAQAVDIEFRMRREQVSDAIQTLRRCTELTPAGHRFVDGMSNTLAGWPVGSG